MKKRLLALLLAGLLTALLAACGASDAQPPEEADGDGGVAARDLRIGLLLSGDRDSVYDKGHLEGLEDACQSLGIDFDAQVSVREVKDDNACTDAVAALAGDGCQIIFSVSPGRETALLRAAALCPDVQFCQVSGFQAASDNGDNTHNYYARVYEAWYLAGVAAGLRTGTGNLGYVASLPHADVISGFSAYYLGAKSVRPDVTMLVSYTGKRADEQRETAAAQALIDQGCDVISHHTYTAAPVAAAERNGVYAVGFCEDWTSVAPNAALTSVRIQWSVYYSYALDCLLSGEAIDQDWCGGWDDGACTLTPFNEDAVADGTQEAVEAAADGLADGSVQVFAGPLHGTDADGNQLTLDRGEAYQENETSSAPSFIYIPDGVVVLS